MAKAKRRRKPRARRNIPVLANPRRRRRVARRRTTARRNPAFVNPRRRRRARRNPAIVAMLTRGVMDASIGAASQLVAEAICAQIPNFIDPPAKGGKGEIGPKVNKIVVAAGLGFAANAALGAEKARAVVQGALQAVIVDVARPALVKAGLLSSYLPRMGSYSPPRQLTAGMGSYVSAPRMLAGVPDEDDAFGAGATQ